MTPATKNPDITIRGGLINVPKSTHSISKSRHQPDTPTNKKDAKPRPDHIPAPTEPQGEETNVSTPASESD